LNVNETKYLFLNLLLSVLNTFLELFSITTIVYLLLVISGQTENESRISLFFEKIISQENLIISSASLMILVIIVKTVYQIYFSYFQESISHNIQKRLNNSLFEKFINSKYENYLSENSSRIIRVLSQESIKIGNQLISPLISILNESLLLLLISGFIFLYDPVLGSSVYMTSFLLIVFFSKFISSKVRNLGKVVAKNNNERIKNISEAYRSFDLIKIYNFQDAFMKIYKKHTSIITNAGSLNMFYAKLPKNIFELFIFTFLFFVIIILDYTNRNEQLITYLSILAVSIYKIIPSLNKISSSLQVIQYFASPFSEIIKILNEPINIPAKYLTDKFKVIDYERISFNYLKGKSIFNNVDFKISKRDFIGIYGPSGSGKSTFIKLICGLLIPSKGNVKINDKKIKSNILHNYFSYVPQDPFILDESIVTNIAFNFSNEKIDFERITNVLKKVKLFEKFKDRLYDTLGDSGVKVSGGQKQRIAIARALYHDKKIIILDESTSNLDPNTESKILELLKILNQNLTVILISHKQESMIYCNKIYEINKNKVIRK
jgi:ATP-binding cassette, subfamily B, bacterial PglK